MAMNDQGELRAKTKFLAFGFESLPKADLLMLVVASVAPLLILVFALFSVDLNSILLSGRPGMFPITALCILLSACSLWMAHRPKNTLWARVPAAAVVVIAVGILGRYLFVNWEQLLLGAQLEVRNALPQFALMSPQSCCALLAISISHLFFFSPKFQAHKYAKISFQTLNLLALCISVFAALGYVYSITKLFGLSHYIGISVPTGISVFLLALGSLRLDPKYGFARVCGQQNAAGYFIRKFVVGGVLAPFILAGIVRWVEVTYGVNSNYGMAAFVFFTVACIILLGITTARSLEKVEHQEKEIHRKQSEVDEANEAGKLREKFLANMSHEVRTPLTAIMGYLDFVDEPVMDINERLELIRRAKRSAKSLLRVLDDILDLSKSAGDHIKLRMSSFSLKDLLPDLISQFYLEAKAKGLIIDYSIDASVPPGILSDPNRLQQILMNLLSNAVKFTDHGRIDISVTYEKSAIPNEGILSIDVQDTGPGIPRDAQDKLFRNFYQVDDSITRRHGGSGIGLALSQNLAILMNGRLYLKSSEIHKGSIFNLRIPCQALMSGPTNIRVPTEFAQDEGLNNVNVLLVEDNIDNQNLVCRYLAKVGAQVEVAENGKIGVEKAMQRIYSVILMDIQMPVMGGLEATRLLRQKGYQGLIIALSAHASEEHQNRSLAAGCDAHLSKPIDRNELVRSIQFMLQDLDATV